MGGEGLVSTVAAPASLPSTELVILRELLAREPGFMSGAALAGRLGLSRVAVWQHMEKLRTQRFAFESARARGYRIAQRPAALHLSFILAHLQGRARDFSITLLDEVDSTNDEAARQLAAGRPAPFVILARRQTRGRGRLGRAWHSEANGNLYSSFAFRPTLAPAEMTTFTLWMGVNVCELIANFCHVAPALKWPNDLLFDGRKAGGMLTEANAKIAANFGGTLVAPEVGFDVGGVVDPIMVEALEAEVARLERLQAEDEARAREAAAERERVAAEEAARLAAEEQARVQAEAAEAARLEAERVAAEAAEAAAQRQAEQAVQPQPRPQAPLQPGFNLNFQPAPPVNQF